MAVAIPLEDTKKTKDVGQVSQFTLMRRRFMQSKLSVFGMIALAVLYAMAILAPFLGPYNPATPHANDVLRPPSTLTIANGAISVCGSKQVLNTVTLTYSYAPDCSKSQPLTLFPQGWSYHLFGFIPTNRHLFGVNGSANVYLLGTDELGRDMLARILTGAQVSLTIGVVAVLIWTILGAILGTASGFFGGWIDTGMQRVIELLLALPTLSFWLILTALLPQGISIVARYLLITVVLAFIAWTGLARQVRAKVMGYKGQDYTAGARLAGATSWRIILDHMMPNSFSHIVAVAALGIPAAILAETTLSFLGFGMQPPAISWGVLLQDAIHIKVVEQNPWLMIPAVVVVFAVTCYLLIGDGLRDAVDPYG
jgi:peptide/nickel transport system permease protein